MPTPATAPPRRGPTAPPPARPPHLITAHHRAAARRGARPAAAPVVAGASRLAAAHRRARASLAAGSQPRAAGLINASRFAAAHCRARATRPTASRGHVRAPRLAAAHRRARASLPGGRPSLRSARGQASVELVVLLPVILVVLAVGYQGVLAGQAVWEVRVAARAAARAHAFGGDPSAAARTHLRSGLERGLRVTPEDEGAVRVSVRVPAVIPSIRLGRVSATAHFRPQSG